MKKKILLLAVALMLFAGVVSASSINGDYKGNPIVKIMSDGRQLETDEVPGMILDGHTMVPISTLRQLGASVTWDAYGYSVDVRLPQGTQTPGYSQNGDVETIKLYSKIADHYKRLSLLGDGLFNLGGTFSLAYQAISTNRNAIDRLTISYDRLNARVKDYNEMLHITESVTIEAKQSGIVLTDMDAALNRYRNGLDTYGNSYEAINKYFSDRSSRNFDDYLNNAQKGDDIVDPVIREMNRKYHEWYSKIQNY